MKVHSLHITLFYLLVIFIILILLTSGSYFYLFSWWVILLTSIYPHRLAPLYREVMISLVHSVLLKNSIFPSKFALNFTLSPGYSEMFHSFHILVIPLTPKISQRVSACTVTLWQIHFVLLLFLHPCYFPDTKSHQF